MFIFRQTKTLWGPPKLIACLKNWDLGMRLKTGKLKNVAPPRLKRKFNYEFGAIAAPAVSVHLPTVRWGGCGEQEGVEADCRVNILNTGTGAPCCRVPLGSRC
jgi:hypothetical protein